LVQSRRQRWQELQGRLCCRRSLHRLRRQWIFAFTDTDRDVDCWGGSLEAKFWGRDPVQVRPNLLRTDYLLIGADKRGIDQNNDLNGSWSARTVFKYNEDLNTTYYGGYISFGGEYSLGFLGTGGLWESLGSAPISRPGPVSMTPRPTMTASLPSNSSRSLSKDDLAFIGSVSFETRKQFGPRTSLSVWSAYEYISSVPEMRDSNGDRPTRIETTAPSPLAPCCA
jgi:hypothetical protein